MNETYVRVGGRWQHLWHVVDQNGQFIEFRPTARRDAKAFLKQAIERVRSYRPERLIDMAVANEIDFAIRLMLPWTRV